MHRGVGGSATSPTTAIRSRARTFYLGSLFLPRSVRRDVHLIYAYFREIDDLVDEPSPTMSRSDVVQELDAWQTAIQHGDGGRPLATALESIIVRYDIPRDYLCMVIEGARFDITLQSVESMDELMRYSVLVAGSVGMVMAHVLGARQVEAIEAARDLGTAMQITNVLRDVGEDLRRGRIYLPRTELQRCGCDVGRLAAVGFSPETRTVMELLAVEARTLYARGLSGIRYLPQSCQFGVYLSAVLYARILDKIEHNQFDVFSQRARLGTAEKWSAVLPAYIAHRRVRAS